MRGSWAHPARKAVSPDPVRDSCWPKVSVVLASRSTQPRSCIASTVAMAIRAPEPVSTRSPDRKARSFSSTRPRLIFSSASSSSWVGSGSTAWLELSAVAVRVATSCVAGPGPAASSSTPCRAAWPRAVSDRSCPCVGVVVVSRSSRPSASIRSTVCAQMGTRTPVPSERYRSCSDNALCFNRSPPRSTARRACICRSPAMAQSSLPPSASSAVRSSSRPSPWAAAPAASGSSRR